MTEKIENNRKNVEASIVDCTKMLTQAELLMDAAKAFKNSLSTTTQSIKDMVIVLDPALALFNPGGANGIGTELVAQCSKPPNIAVVIQYAENVHSLAIERLQVALVERDMAENSAKIISTSISMLIEVNREKQRELGRRNLYGLPPEVWAQIFAEATLPDRESPSAASPMPVGWIHGSRAMLLASVCGEWRGIVINTKALWSTISMAPGKQATDALARLVELHLTRMGLLPYDVVIILNKGIKCNYDELKNIPGRANGPRQVYFYFHSSARDHVSKFYSMIPDPSNLVLEVADVDSFLTISLPLRGSALKSLKLISCGLSENMASALTHFEVKQRGGSYSDMCNWTMRSLDMLEHVALRYRNANIAPETKRNPLPRLRYFETSTSLLTNRTMHLWRTPNLQELVIVDAEEYDNQRWEQFATRLGSETCLKKLTVDSIIGDAVQGIVGSLTVLPTVTTLELRGKSVEVGLKRLKGLLERQTLQIPNLQTLVITDYVGGGNAILDIIASIQIKTVNCSNFSREVIQALLLQRQGF